MGNVRRQAVSTTILVYLGTAIGFISLAFIQPHYLSKEELGLTRLILSFSSVLSILFSLGISAVTVRYMPRMMDRDTKHRGFFGFLLIYTGVAVVFGTISLLIFKGAILSYYDTGGSAFKENFGYVFLLTIILSFVVGFNAYCIALMRVSFTTFLNDVVIRLLFISLILVHAAGWLDLNGFLLFFCLIYAFQGMALLVAIFSIDKPGMLPDMGFIRGSIGLRSILRYGTIITLTAMNSVTLRYIDTMFVGTIAVESVAVYSVAAFLGLAVEIPLNALERVTNPKIASALARNEAHVVARIYHESARSLLLIGGALFILVALNADDFFKLLPEGYSEGARITKVVALGALINMVTGVNYPILTNSHKYVWGSVFLVLLLAFTILGNLILLPSWGILGPAIAACCASIVYNGLKFEFIRRAFKLQPFDANTFKQVLLIAACYAIGANIPLDLGPISAILVRSLVVCGIYLGATVVMGTVADLYHHVPKRWSRMLPKK